MTLEEIRARRLELRNMLNDENADLEAIEKEMNQLEVEERRLTEQAEAQTRAQEQRRSLAERLSNGTARANVVSDSDNTQTELRDTLEYQRAFLRSVLYGDNTQLRSLVTVNGEGTVPVPTNLEREIANAWEEQQLVNLCHHTNMVGNIELGFEYSATGANVVAEGGEGSTEEVLALGKVTLIAENIIKWITLSDAAIDNTTIDTLNEIYKEVAQKIAEKVEEVIVGKIVSAPAVSDTTHCGVPTFKATTIALDTLINAEAELSGKAKRLTLAASRKTLAAFKAVAAKNNYRYDIFEGLDTVVTDELPDYGTASDGQTYAIVGDFGYGFRVNTPNGNGMNLNVDRNSLAEKGLNKVVGKQMVGCAVKAPKSFVKLVK